MSTSEDQTDLEEVFKKLCALEQIHTVCPSQELLDSIDRGNIAAIAQTYGVRHRKISLPKNWWDKDNGTILGFHTDGTPVILRYSSGYSFSKSGKTVTVNNENSGDIQPFGYVFYNSFHDDPVSLRQLISTLLSESKKELFLTTIFTLFQAICFAALPIALYYLNTHDQTNDNLRFFIVILIISQTVLWLYKLTGDILVIRLSSRPLVRLQAAVWDRLLKLPVSFFQSRHPSQLAQQCIGLTRNREVISRIVSNAIALPILITTNLVLCFIFSSYTACAIVLSLIVIAAFSFRFNRMAESCSKKQRVAHRLNSSLLHRIVNAVSTLKTLGGYDHLLSKWERNFKRSETLNRSIATDKIFDCTTEKLFLFYTIVLLFVLHPISTDPSRASLGAAAISIVMLSTNVSSLFKTISDILTLISLYSDIRPVLTTLPESSGKSVAFSRLHGSIELKNIDFSYSKLDKLVCRDISLKIKQGSYVGVIGASGSGKSTLLKLLLGFEQPDRGGLLYDGVDVNSLDMAVLRSRMGLVLQNDQLMPGTVLGAIIGHCPDVDIDEVWAAAESAGVADDIREMSMEMATIVDEIKLSGSQKQRLLIARALIRKPEILILDEATGMLDSHLQEHIKQHIRSMNATRIVIAHRISSVVDCDTIVVMKEGQVIEQGSYDALLANNGEFAKLVALQDTVGEEVFA